MDITFLGAAHEVTGSCTLLNVGGKNILIDCGMEQGKDIYENGELPVSPADIDCVLLTHAHIDHSGKLPLLAKNGYKGKIFTTEATARLCKIMLLDSAHIQEFEAEWRNRKAKRAGADTYIPLYTTDDVSNMIGQFKGCHYEKSYKILPGITARFIDAGHLLGSASIELTLKTESGNKVLLFSGDIGNINRPLINDPKYPEFADYVVIESTYGNRLHGERKDYLGQLTDVIKETLDRGGNVVIPSFAVGRTQELLYLIKKIKENNLVKGHSDFPVWIDSPLAVEVTNIYKKGMEEYYDKETLELLSKCEDVLSFPGLNFSVTSADSRAINADEAPKVIISSSGMCEAGRIRHHLKHNLWRKDSTILFVGYQAEGTLGRKLLNGEKSVKIFGEEIIVNAEIRSMDGISGHGDMNILLEWLKNLITPPKQVFVNHGNDDVCDIFAENIKTTLGYNATAPYNGAIYKITDSGVICTKIGNKTKIVKGAAHLSDAGKLYSLLVDSGNELLAVIKKCKGMPNKDLRKFIFQIKTLIEQWKK